MKAWFLGWLTLGLVGLGGAAHAQSADATASAFLVTPLSFVKQDDLDFGKIIPSNTNGTVTMDETGAVTTTGGVVVVAGSQSPARFWGYGTFNQRVRINLDQNRYWLNHPNGTDRMRLDRLTIGSSPPTRIGTAPRVFRIANPDGYFAFTIAGRLRVGANQTPGVYTGNFVVTLDYL